jgi:ribonuclease P protein component
MHYERGVGPLGVAFLAGKRVGGAVKRNRARRVLREAFRTSDADLAGVKTLVFVATEKTGGAPHTDITDALNAALRRASNETG